MSQREDVARSFTHTNPRPPGDRPAAAVKEKRRPPESERYDELKGKLVVVVLGVDVTDAGLAPIVTGTLRWVDRYTIGVEIEDNDGEIIGKANQVWMISKSHVVMIGEA